MRRPALHTQVVTKADNNAELMLFTLMSCKLIRLWMRSGRSSHSYLLKHVHEMTRKNSSTRALMVIVSVQLTRVREQSCLNVSLSNHLPLASRWYNVTKCCVLPSHPQIIHEVRPDPCAYVSFWGLAWTSVLHLRYHDHRNMREAVPWHEEWTRQS